MIETFESILGQSVYMTELYDFLELEKGQYSRFCELKIFKNEFAESNKDYLTIMSSNAKAGKRGQFRKEIILNIDFAKKLCMVSKSKKGEEIRNYLVLLTKQLENRDLLTHEQVIYLTQLKEFFKFVVNQKNIESEHKNNFVNSHKGSYAEFNIWRNKILGIEPDKIECLLKDFCLQNQKRYPNNLSKQEKINLMDLYAGLKNAVWDFLSIKGEINALKLAELVKNMAKTEGIQIYRYNETNLFQQKQEIENVLKSIK